MFLLAGMRMAFLIKSVRTPLNESFHLGSSIYVWIFVKILIEVFEEFLKLWPDSSFGLHVYGELFCCFHTTIFLTGHMAVLLLQGRGNDDGLLHLSVEHLNESKKDAKV